MGYLTPHSFDFVEPASVVTEEAAFINRLICELDTIADRDLLLARLGEAVDQIKEYCSPIDPG
jgi:hypothetical protein